MLADIRSQQEERETKRENGLPAPPKPPLNRLTHPPGTIRDPHRCGRIKTNPRNVRSAQTRGARASILTIPISPPREITKRLWNVANTYWRHGIPVKLFETGASQQRHKAEDERTANVFPKWKLRQRGASNTTKHCSYTHGLEVPLAEAHTCLLNRVCRC
ncbi:hypothetical protein EDD15DRAFT_2193771 [Pisolithus albus]|nr:hypothetical protein EDD15DRAFT_2193771 [Pisolithus albus]